METDSTGTSGPRRRSREDVPSRRRASKAAPHNRLLFYEVLAAVRSQALSVPDVTASVPTSTGNMGGLGVGASQP